MTTKANEIKTTRTYRFTQAELKAKLGIVGDVQGSGLYRGLSPAEERAGKSTDTTVWYIETVEEKKEKEDD